MGGQDPGLVCGAPRAFDGRRFAQGVNGSPRTCKAAAVLFKSSVLRLAKMTGLLWVPARQPHGYRTMQGGDNSEECLYVRCS
jgi:hypothetical protein